MAALIPWGRSPMISLQREIEDLLEDVSSPRAFRRELDRLFASDLSPRSLWTEIDRLMDDFESPPTLRSRIGRLFESTRGLLPFTHAKTTFVPSVELVEQDKEYVLKADLPGMREQDVDVRIDDDNVLTIRGERREERTKTLRGYEYSERAYGSFSRSVALPVGIDAGKIEAEFHNGVLEVHVPKSQQALTARKIPIGREEPRVLPGNGPTAQASRETHS